MLYLQIVDGAIIATTVATSERVATIRTWEDYDEFRRNYGKHELLCSSALDWPEGESVEIIEICNEIRGNTVNKGA